ncbi:MAG: HEPN domain-containing protein, partial [Nanoarchaeota archaeon]|nr:HEPN domain-containing protein [Nanoarchaeota archaeon]
MEKKYLDEFKIAREFLEVSKSSFKSSLRTSANRWYFAFEKAVISYFLFLEKKVPKNHQKIWNLCSEHLGENFYDHFRGLYDLRMQADYGNVSKFVSLDEGVLRGLIEKSELLIRGVGIENEDKKMKNKKSHENIGKSRKTKKSVAYFPANAWLGNSGIENI